MLGATTFSENAIADQGILFFGVSEQSGISSSANVGVGIMSGVATMDGNFTATTAGMYISGSTNAEMSFNGLQSESTAFLVNLGVSSMESAFTETSNGIMIGSGVATTDFNMTQTSDGGESGFAPFDSANRHYQAILEWVAEGNTIAEAD